MARTYNVIDADGHVLEPVDIWDKYIDPAYRERAPRIIVDTDGKERLQVGEQVLEPLLQRLAAAFHRPAAAVINFNPAIRQTTSGKGWYPNPVYTFLYGYRCARLSEIEVKLRRLTWFKRRIIDGSLQGTIHNQCHSVNARRETFQNVTTVLICFNGRQQPAAILRFNSHIHAVNGMSLGILNDTFEHGVRGRCACDQKHDPNETNPS